MIRDGMTGDWIGTFIGHKGAVWQARLSEDAALAATASADFTAKVWDTHTGENLATLQHNHIVRSIAFPAQDSPKILATGGHEKKLRVYDLSHQLTISPETSDPSSPTTAANGNSLTNGTTKDTSNAQSTTATNISSHEIGPGVHQGSIKSIIWAPENPHVITTACEDQQIRWWDLRSRSSIATCSLDGPLGSAEYATGVLSVAAGKSAYFFSGSTPGQLLKKVDTGRELATVALHAGARKFVTGGAGDTWVRIWDFEREEEIDIGKGHHGPVWTTAFSPDGKLYGTGSEDGTVKLWKFTDGPYGLWR